MRKILASAVLFCSVIFVTLFVSCAQDMNYGSIALRMPSSSSRGSTNGDTTAQTGQQQGSSSSTTYNYVIDIDGPTKTSETASSGETIFINSLLAGDYTVTCTSYDSKNNFVARGSEKARVEPNQTASVKIKLQKEWLEPEIQNPTAINFVFPYIEGTNHEALFTCSATVQQEGTLNFTWYECDSDGTPNGSTTISPATNLSGDKFSTIKPTVTEPGDKYYICKVEHVLEGTNQTAEALSPVHKISVKRVESIDATFTGNYLTTDTDTNLLKKYFKVVATYEDDSQGDISSHCTYSTDQQSTVGNVPVTISLGDKKCTVNVPFKYESNTPTVEIDNVGLTTAEDQNYSVTFETSLLLTAKINGLSKFNKKDGTEVSDTVNYQWQKSTDNGTTFTNIAGATQATYTITEKPSNGTIYRCKVDVTPNPTYSTSTSIPTQYTETVTVNVLDTQPSGDAVTTWEALVSAIGSAGNGDTTTITIGADLTAESPITITKKITLVTPTGSSHTITRGANCQTVGSQNQPAHIFIVDQNGELSLGTSGGTLTIDGGSKSGYTGGPLAGIYNMESSPNSSLMIGGKCILQNNNNSATSKSNYMGGALGFSLFATSSANCSITVKKGAKIQNNASYHGGAIYYAGVTDNAGSLIIESGATIAENNANVNGGAIYATKGKIELSGTLTGNMATTNTTTTTNVGGGAIYATSGAILTINGATITGNSTDKGKGGGIFISAGVTATITGSTIKGNTVKSTSTAPNISGTFTLNGTDSQTITDTQYIENGQIKSQ